MPFKDGESGNPNGRPIGSKNKVDLNIKILINKLLKAIDDAGIDGVVGDSKADTLVNALVKLAPKDLHVTHEVKESRFLKAVEEAKKEIKNEDKS